MDGCESNDELNIINPTNPPNEHHHPIILHIT